MKQLFPVLFVLGLLAMAAWYLTPLLDQLERQQ